MIFYEKWGLVLFIIAEVKTKGKTKMKPKFQPMYATGLGGLVLKGNKKTKKRTLSPALWLF